MKKYMKPAYFVTVGSSFWNLVKSRTNELINYDTDVLEIPIIKTLGLSRTVSEKEIFSSGITYDYISQTSGAEITLGAVALPNELLDSLEGAVVDGGFTFNNVRDLGKEFAFGYWGENSDGSFMYYWHPVCKLVPTDESLETKEKDIPDPNRQFKIVIIPLEDGLWRVKYSTADAIKDGGQALTKDEFFAKPIYKVGELPEPSPEG